MIRAIYFTASGEQQQDIALTAVAGLLARPSGFLWLDLYDEPLPVCEEILRGTFGFHPLAVDDALNQSHTPKLDDWQAYLYVVLHGIENGADSRRPLALPELDIFLSQRFLVTYHTEPLLAVERIWRAVTRDDRLQARGPDRIFYRLADELINDHIHIIDSFADGLDSIEGQIFSSPTGSTLEQIFVMKRRLLQLRRTILPQREVFHKLARNQYDAIDSEDRVFFSDLYDHMVRLHEHLEGLRDLASGSLDTYLSVVNNRMNDIMKLLTIITTLFMPLSFITGFFGMNFFQAVAHTEAWTSLPAFEIAVAMMLALPLVMVWWMRSRDWM